MGQLCQLVQRVFYRPARVYVDGVLRIRLKFYADEDAAFVGRTGEDRFFVDGKTSYLVFEKRNN